MGNGVNESVDIESLSDLCCCCVRMVGMKIANLQLIYSQVWTSSSGPLRLDLFLLRHIGTSSFAHPHFLVAMFVLLEPKL